MEPTLVILAAGLSRRYGRPKATVPIGPRGETLIDYAVFDAWRTGFGDVVIVTRSGIQREIETTLIDRWPQRTIRFAHQDAAMTIHGKRFTPPSAPLGTGHAVLAARDHVHGSFVSINCDDFYGVQSYQLARAHLSQDAAEHALVGYRIASTLSPTGGVSRAVCDSTSSGLLRGLTELLDVRRENARIRGVTPDGERRVLQDTDIISMNFWAFRPTIFSSLESQFAQFLAKATEPNAEFRLSTAIDALVRSEDIRVHLLRSDGPWFGITRPEDQPVARSTMAALIASGEYPPDIATPPATA